MYKIETKDYGFKLTFGDFIKEDEMRLWVEESKQVLAKAPKEFGIFVEMITLKPLPPESKSVMQEGQLLYKQKGMIRSVVILDSPTTTMQFKRIAKETGISTWERYIDASHTKDWEKVGIDWIKNGIDPDK